MNHNALLYEKLYIKNVAEKGRGVFAAKPIRKGDIVEAAPVIVIPDEDVDLIDQTAMADYYFKWGESHFALVLGYGSLYNFSELPNISFEVDPIHEVMIYRAIKSIKKDQELTVHYQCDLWFEPVD
jgi:SET domain-containing protein